jgi:hypothetical protein
MISQRNFNSEYFTNEIMQPLVAKLFPGGKMPHASRLIMHLDNCRVHFSKHTQMLFDKNSIIHVPELSYSPNLAPSDFWLFGHMKSTLQGFKFEGPDDLLQGIHDFSNHLH